MRHEFTRAIISKYSETTCRFGDAASQLRSFIEDFLASDYANGVECPEPFDSDPSNHFSCLLEVQATGGRSVERLALDLFASGSARAISSYQRSSELGSITEFERTTQISEAESSISIAARMIAVIVECVDSDIGMSIKRFAHSISHQEHLRHNEPCSD